MTENRIQEIRERLNAAQSHAAPSLHLPRVDLEYLLAEIDRWHEAAWLSIAAESKLVFENIELEAEIARLKGL